MKSAEGCFFDVSRTGFSTGVDLVELKKEEILGLTESQGSKVSMFHDTIAVIGPACTEFDSGTCRSGDFTATFLAFKAGGEIDASRQIVLASLLRFDMLRYSLDTRQANVAKCQHKDTFRVYLDHSSEERAQSHRHVPMKCILPCRRSLQGPTTGYRYICNLQIRYKHAVVVPVISRRSHIILLLPDDRSRML